MKLVLLTARTSSETWAQEASRLYQKKIEPFFKIEEIVVQSSSQGREAAEQKRKADTLALCEKIKDDDYVILFDEKGLALNSIEFSKKIENALSSSKKRMIFVIGGAYGVTEEIKKRSQLMVNLGRLTLNHTVAQTVAYEQIYRALTIIKGLPYHNS